MAKHSNPSRTEQFAWYMQAVKTPTGESVLLKPIPVPDNLLLIWPILITVQHNVIDYVHVYHGMIFSFIFPLPIFHDRNDWWLTHGIGGYLAGLFSCKAFGNTEYMHWIRCEQQKVCAYEHDHTLPPLSIPSSSSHGESLFAELTI